MPGSNPSKLQEQVHRVLQTEKLGLEEGESQQPFPGIRSSTPACTVTGSRDRLKVYHALEPGLQQSPTYTQILCVLSKTLTMLLLPIAITIFTFFQRILRHLIFKVLEFRGNLKYKKDLVYLLQDPNILHYILLNSNPVLKLKIGIHDFIAVFLPNSIFAKEKTY